MVATIRPRPPLCGCTGARGICALHARIGAADASPLARSALACLAALCQGGADADARAAAAAAALQVATRLAEAQPRGARTDAALHAARIEALHIAAQHGASHALSFSA
jgi:hypothetical protein